MKRTQTTKFIFALAVIFLLAQQIFSKARPYFQQHVAYTIHVKLDDTRHTLSADETVVYTNNSPDTLREIYFHLWPNGYRNNRTPFARQRLAEGQKDFHDAKPEDRGYIDSLHFKADNEDIRIEYMIKSHEIAKLILNKPLLPGRSVTISTPFYVKVPKTFSRMGHSGQAYYISQWYPKPAVYDRNGWNTFPYLDQGEFYSEYGSFDVFITLPENYVVAATGRLQNATERDWLNKIAIKDQVRDTSKSMSFKGIAINTTSKNKADSFPPSSKTFKTLEYIQDSVHDFAWFADKRYIVEKTEVKLPSGRAVTCWGMYTPSLKHLWQGSAGSVAKTIKFYSEQVGEYPYPSATAVSGDLMPTAGGMEYPMVTIISTKSDLESVIVHEVGHNWFYGILGSNERQHAWMDEGINTFYEKLCDEKKIALAQYFKGNYNGVKLSGLGESTLEAGAYIVEARQGLDQPIDIAAADYTETNYGAIVYGKTPIILRYMYYYLGDMEFKKIMHIYFDEWKFRHPLPQDIKEVFETNSKKDVSPFFNDLLKTDKKMDYAITSVKKDGNNYDITVKNTGQVAAPVFAAIGTKDSIQADTVVYNPAKKYTISLPSTGPAVGYAMINPFPLSPDVNFANNEYQFDPATGRCKPLHLQGFFGMERPDKTNIIWIPALAWNDQDKWMLGAGISSDILPAKNFSYELMPMYGFGSKTLTGLGRISYSFNPYSADMRHFIEIGVNGKRFTFDETVAGRYTKIQPFISWEFQEKPFEGRPKQQIAASSSFIYNTIGNPENQFPVSEYPSKLVVNELQYTIKLGPFIHLFEAGIDAQNIQGKANRLTAEMVFRRPSPIRNQQIYFRFFAGTMFSTSTTDSRYYIPMGGIGGYQDFAYNNLYLDRSGTDRVFGQQIEPGAGGFKFISNSGAFSTKTWMTTANIAANIPKWPVKIYLDGGIFQDTANKVRFEYSGGLSLNLFQDNFEIFFPIIYSNDLKTYLNTLHQVYGRQITFRINLKALDPKKLPGYLFGGK